jgi:hypothetical protein
VNTSFYTPPQLVSALWALVEHLGFKGGRIVEPSAGPGHVIAGMPHSVARKSTITAVELDPTSAGLLETCFAPYGLQAHACGMEVAKLPVGFFDLCVGNLPFGDFKTNDTSKAPYSDWLIHNWFLGKSLELVRPGGLVAVITSRGSLDSKTDTHRRWLAAHAELVAAFRLPTMAFEAHANTEAVTDIVVFKRRELPDFASTPYWVQTEHANQALFAPGEPATCTQYYRHNGQSYTVHQHVNAHFNRHPDAVVGRLKWESTQHGKTGLPVFDGDMEALAERLETLIEALPSGIYEPAKAELVPAAQSPMARYANLDQDMPGAFVIHNGRICISEGDELLDVNSLYTGTARKRVIGMMEVRNAAVEVIQHQAKSEDDVELQRLQRHLNRTYDAYVAQLGALSTTANSRIMRSDPNWPLLLALEIWDEETETVTKADIFTKRTVGIPEVPKTVDTVKDALLVSLALYGKIDLRDMAKRYGKPVRDVVEELRAEGLAYRDPVLARWVPADEYLSGHIREKITQAKAAGPAYEGNIPALEAVLPQDLGPAEVEARLGAPWIPCDVIQEFATQLVNDTRNQIEVTFDKSTATWSVKSGAYRLEYTGERALQVMKWGTDERCALTLLEAALNQQPPTITRKVNESTVVDAAATFAAREKWQAIRDEFRMWVYRDDARRDRLLRIYNDTFNQVRPRQFDGSHLHLPGMSKVVTPWPHQKNAIWRVLVQGNTLLAHCVGAGKTLVMVGASMELRRLGQARKPLHTVPNHCLSQYVAEAVRLYPQARVMVAMPSDTLKAIVADLVRRADAIRNRTVRPEEDNMLAITNDGRRAALDVRLIDPSLPADPSGKLAQVAQNVYRIWNNGTAQRHAQLVFCDLGTPKAIGFSVYEEVRRLLIELGIPADEIAFVQDYDSDTAKARLFKKVRDGSIRVLMGSTQKMGTGTNVQKRLKGVHQICCPWRPSDVEQRDGRAERQGNECDEIELWRYVTQESFDAYSWNLIDVKARFIEQVMTAEQGLRSVEDISMTAMSYAELKALASGNPLVIEKAAVDAKVQKLALTYNQWEQDRWRLSRRKVVLQERMNWIDGNMAAIEQDASAAAATGQGAQLVPLKDLARQAVESASSTAEAIGGAFRALSAVKSGGPFAQVNGFELSLERGFMGASELVVTAPNSGLRATADRPNMNDVIGVGRAALKTIAAIADDPARLREEFGRKTEEMASVEKMLTGDFEHREALEAARARQTEIEALLDLDKDTAGSQTMNAEAA